MNYDCLPSMIEKAKVVSFDIFDTLLLRPYVHPQDLFIHLEQIYNAKGFAKQRMEAGGRYYKHYGHRKEVNLASMYQQIPDFSYMMQHELDWEMQVLTVNPTMKKYYDLAINLAKGGGKKVVLCSDMYLPLAFVEELLDRRHILGYEKLYLSNHLNLRKDRGDMFEFLIKDQEVEPSKILHIGDNKESDQNRPKEFGIQTFLIPRKTKSLFARDKVFKEFYGIRHSIGASITTALVSQRRPTNEYWIDFGYKIAGPLVYSYARWINHLALKRGLKKLLFIARDGFIVQKIFNTFNKSIKTQYIYTPRLISLFTSLEVDPNSKKQAEAIYRYYQEQSKERPPEFTDGNIKGFCEWVKKEKVDTGYGEYVERIVDGYNPVGVVDTISIKLTGQRLIEKEAGHHTVGFYFLLLNQKNNIFQENERYSYISGENEDSFIRKQKCDIVELICSSPENPIQTMFEGKLVYRELIDKAESLRQVIYKKIEIGAMNFAEDVAKRFNGEDIFLSSVDTAELLNQFVKWPKKEDIKETKEIKKDHTTKYLPIFSSAAPFWKPSEARQVIWPTFAQKFGLAITKPIWVKLRNHKLEIWLLPYLRGEILAVSFFGHLSLKIGRKKEDL